MIRICPFCGHKLKNFISDGITTCSNCERVFDSSRKNKVLSASWMIRKWHVDLEVLDLKEEDKKIIQEYIVEKLFSHDEFLEIIDKLIY